MYHLKQQCRACGSDNLEPVFDLGVQPLANSFRYAHEEQTGSAPLRVLFCHDCTNSQLSVVVSPKVLYSNYPYVTSPSATMRAHFDSVCSELSDECGRGSVIEIGSNDGLFLQCLHEHGFGPLLGVDPAENLTAIAAARSFSTICGMWNRKTAVESIAFISKPRIIIARHVFCHIDDWDEFIETMAVVATPDTTICIEVPYVADMLSGCEFDTVYHEHLDYLSLKAMETLLKGTDFHIHKLIHAGLHGGVVLFMLKHNDAHQEPYAHVRALIDAEDVSIERWQVFAKRAEKMWCELHGMVEELVLRQHKSVWGFGASAKSTVWIAASGIGKWVSAISDTTPQKIGRANPGSHIPIVSQDELLEFRPDYAIVFAWNYRREILEKMKPYLDAGGKFIFPVPEIEVVGNP